ncbi:hypothetical protein [Ancylomarina sp.]|uniref:hypothetical protein n=1 Tax=Ancylomarina sp. TaxID=1970196 RepID=UPI00356A1D39
MKITLKYFYNSSGRTTGWTGQSTYGLKPTNSNSFFASVKKEGIVDKPAVS